MNSSDPSFKKRVIRLAEEGVNPGVIKWQREMSIHFVDCADGTVGQWEAFHAPTFVKTVSVAAFTSEGKMILVRMFRFPVRSWCIDLPGGDNKEGESLKDAVMRELLEETGYATDGPVDILSSGYISTAHTNVPHLIFYASNCFIAQEPVRDAMEVASGMEVVLMSPTQIMRNIANLKNTYGYGLSRALLLLSYGGTVKFE